VRKLLDHRHQSGRIAARIRHVDELHLLGLLADRVQQPLCVPRGQGHQDRLTGR